MTGLLAYSIRVMASPEAITIPLYSHARGPSHLHIHVLTIQNFSLEIHMTLATNILAAVYEYERIDAHAAAALEFILEHGHNPSMHRSCRNAQRRLDSWMDKLTAFARTCDDDQLKALFDLCDVTPVNLGL